MIKQKIPEEIRRKLLEKLGSLPAGAFRDGNIKRHPYSTDVANYDSSYQFYDSKEGLLFLLAKSPRFHSPDDAVRENLCSLRVYAVKRRECDLAFETSGVDITRLYYDIDSKKLEANVNKTEMEERNVLKKLKEFAGE